MNMKKIVIGIMALSLLSSGYGVYAETQLGSSIGSSIGSSTTIGTSTPKIYVSGDKTIDVTSVTVEYDGKSKTLSDEKTATLVDYINYFHTAKITEELSEGDISAKVSDGYTKQDAVNYDISSMYQSSIPMHLDLDLFTLTKDNDTIYVAYLNLLFPDNSNISEYAKFNNVEDYNKFIQLAQDNSNLTTSDLLKVKKYLLGTTTEISNDYDLNGDNRVTSTDLLIIKKVLLGLA